MFPPAPVFKPSLSITSISIFLLCAHHCSAHVVFMALAGLRHDPAPLVMSELSQWCWSHPAIETHGDFSTCNIRHRSRIYVGPFREAGPHKHPGSGLAAGGIALEMSRLRENGGPAAVRDGEHLGRHGTSLKAHRGPPSTRSDFASCISSPAVLYVAGGHIIRALELPMQLVLCSFAHLDRPCA